MGYVIFLSPSEDKNIDTHNDKNISLDSNKLDYLESLWIKNNKNLLTHRQNTIKLYNNCLEKIINKNDRILLKEIYGSNNFNEKSANILHLSLEKNTLIQAIRLYGGVAFKEINFEKLDSISQEIILKKTYIFSNLFGVILASDYIPFYKLKQGCKVNGLTLKDIYKPFYSILESFLAKHLNSKDDVIIWFTCKYLHKNFYSKTK